MILSVVVLIGLMQVPINSAKNGTVTGILRDANGKPAATVRVAAVIPESIGDAANSGAMATITETDSSGRFILEGIPQGRYYIAAGRVDRPTYYPGVSEMSRGTIVSVVPGTTIAGIDFTLDPISVGRAPAGSGNTLSAPFVQIAMVSLQVQVLVEGGGPIPISSGGTPSMLHLSGGPVPSAASLASPYLDLFGPPTAYKASVSNLPPGYTVQSIVYGSTDVVKDSLKLSLADFPPGTPSSPTPSNALPAGQNVFRLFMNSSGGTVFVVNSRGAGVSYPMTMAPVPLVVTLKLPAARVATGAGLRLRGRIPPPGVSLKSTIYASGIAGAVYADGTFEVDGLAPGLHNVISMDGPAMFGAVVAIRDQDVEGITLAPFSLLPKEVRIPHTPDPVGNNPNGAIVQLASIRGRVLDEVTGKSIGPGRVRFFGLGQYKDYPIDAEGGFEITGVFPGVYTLDISSGDRLLLSEMLTINREDITRSFPAR